MAELFDTRPSRLKGRAMTDLLVPVVRRDYDRLVRELSTGRRNRRTLAVRWADRTGEVTVQAAADPSGVGLLVTLRPNPPQPTLSSREAEILRMVAAGETSAAIAARLGLTADGVNYHLRKLTARFGVPNRAALAAQVVL
jgi:DNA-binding CsgD family transcriptional regulator